LLFNVTATANNFYCQNSKDGVERRKEGRIFIISHKDGKRKKEKDRKGPWMRLVFVFNPLQFLLFRSFYSSNNNFVRKEKVHFYCSDGRQKRMDGRTLSVLQQQHQLWPTFANRRL